MEVPDLRDELKKMKDEKKAEEENEKIKKKAEEKIKEEKEKAERRVQELEALLKSPQKVSIPRCVYYGSVV